MESRSILIAYATSYGQTEKIARRIAAVLVRNGLHATVVNVKEPPDSLRLEDYDGVIIGASIIARGHQPAVRDFILLHRDELEDMPSAFYSVCASAGSVHEKGRAAAFDLRVAFLRSIGWTPSIEMTFAGAINYTKYNFLLRWYMKKASKLNGGSTDTSQDHEYTDWSQVERFGVDFADLLTPIHPTSGAGGPSSR